MAQATTNTSPTALVLSRRDMLTTATQVGLEGWRRLLPPEPHYKPARGGWGLLADGPLPDLVVAEHADPLLVAMLAADLLRRARLLDAQLLVLIGERDDVLRHLLAPLPLPLTVTSSAALLRGQSPVPRTESLSCERRWDGVAPPVRVLPRWQVVPLIPALAQARDVAEAAAWCGLARSTAYSILATTARHLRLARRWRSPRQWSCDLLAMVSCPTLEQ